MIHAFHIAALALPLVLQAPPQEQKPSPEAIKAAETALHEAFTKGKAADRVAAIESAANVPDTQVAIAIGKGLRSKERDVQLAAIQALRFMPVPKAFDELDAFWQSDMSLMKKDQDLAAKVLQAIGQHGNPKSINLLAHNPFDTPVYPAVRARLLGLANIRSKESLAKIIGMMRLVDLWTDQAYMDDVRLALFRLTGKDLGKDPNQWFMWYENDKSKIEISKDPPQLPKLEQYQWDSYWAKTPLEQPKPETGGK